MNFTFNFFYPFVTAFTALWPLINHGNHVSPADLTTGCATPTTATVTGRSRRTRTRVSRSATVPGSVSGQSAPRRSARLQQKYSVPIQKPILSSARRRCRTLRREGAIADLQQLEPGPSPITSNTTTTTTIGRQLKREDSFILVDYGNHFRMVKPAYAMRYCHSVPENFRTVAPYHALGAGIGEQELRARLLAVPVVDPTIGTKRVRFVEEEDADDEDVRHRKRRRLS